MPDTPERTPARVRVVVLNWNSWWFTRRCLRALALTEHPADRLEVVLVDNASVDGSLERLRHEFPEVAVVRNEANLGFAEGCNRAMRDLDGTDMVALVNNDAVVDAGWLAAMLDALDRHPDAGAAAARLVLEPRFVRVGVQVLGGPVQVDSVRVDGADATTRTRFTGAARSEGRTDWPMELVHHLDGDAELLVPVGEGRHDVVLSVRGRATVTVSSGGRSAIGRTTAVASPGVVELEVTPDDERVELLNGLGTERNEVAESYDRHFGEANDPSELPELSGAPTSVTGFSGGGVLLRAEMLRQVGLFDPRFFAYYEDSDLSWRAARAGWRTVTAPSAVIRHSFGGSGGSRATGFFFLNYRNWLLTVLRNADGEVRRRALASARERVTWALRANVASPLRHRRAPSWDLVGAWMRTLAGVAVVRLATRRDRGVPPGSVRTDRVRAALQPEFRPRGPARRPGGPLLVAVDLSEELTGAPGAGAELLAAMAAADLSLDVVPVRRADRSGFQRVPPADVGRLLGVPGPHRAVSAADMALEPLPAGTVLVRGTGRGTLAWSALDEEVPGTEVIGRRQVPADPTALHAAVTAASALPEPE